MNTRLLALGRRATGRAADCVLAATYGRPFSHIAHTAEASVAALPKSLYEATAVPNPQVRGERLPSEYKPGYESCRIFDNPNVVEVVRTDGKETLGDRLYRYLDVGGTLSMLNSRKFHILRAPADCRKGIMLSTELERKQGLVINAVISGLMLYVFYHFIQHKRHVYDKPPNVEVVAREFTNNRVKDFTWHGSYPFQYPKGRCKECRWLELECKKRCYDKLLREGHKFILHEPMQAPRSRLYPSPYPPSQA
ncbi:uncharacterized protein BcabD6B2_46310 [Babesia caballi]|uniref:Uncharacterized protein n=1 Tax=Babesia caballi TaxID=5871 RepID=A0AAV4LZD5_BABCB|nr:hypothetical protein, conserved [Babesia caballi]